jgi:membrane-associated protease RseP (regulator of RpoE activity)
MLLVGVDGYRSQEPDEPPGSPESDSALGNLKSQLNELSGVVTTDGAAWLGVTLKDVTAAKVRELKLPGEYGALVENVNEDSAAAKAGLQKGDVIVEFAGERVRSEAQLRRLIRETPAGRTVSLQVIRDGQPRTLSAKLQARTTNFSFQLPEVHVPEINITPIYPEPFDYRGFSFLFDGGRPSLGISGDELTTQLASFFGVKQGKGVLVREVVVGSAAANAGLKAGDVIVAVDGKSVATVAELRKAIEIKSGEEKRKLELTVVRDHHEQTVPVELERPGVGERERVALRLGIDTAALQRVEAEAKAQLAAAQLALQKAQRQLRDRQNLVSETIRRAQERAMQEQLRLQLRKQLHPPAGQNEII